MAKLTHTGRNVLLVNTQDNPDAKMDESTFDQSWNWIAAPGGWQPEDDIPIKCNHLDGIIVFSKRYEERAIRELCETLHGKPRFDGVPILVAVTQYQMPLANRVKDLERGEFLLSPIYEKDLVKRIRQLA